MLFAEMAGFLGRLSLCKGAAAIFLPLNSRHTRLRGRVFPWTSPLRGNITLVKADSYRTLPVVAAVKRLGRNP